MYSLEFSPSSGVRRQPPASLNDVGGQFTVAHLALVGTVSDGAYTASPINPLEKPNEAFHPAPAGPEADTHPCNLR
jgi:hypothetical protein